MNTLKHIGLTLIQLVKQTCLLPKALADAVNEKRRQSVRAELNAERLDRIRNPSKYLGK